MLEITIKYSNKYIYIYWLKYNTSFILANHSCWQKQMKIELHVEWVYTIAVRETAVLGIMGVRLRVTVKCLVLSQHYRIESFKGP